MALFVLFAVWNSNILTSEAKGNANLRQCLVLSVMTNQSDRLKWQGPQVNI